MDADGNVTVSDEGVCTGERNIMADTCRMMVFCFLVFLMVVVIEMMMMMIDD